MGGNKSSPASRVGVIDVSILYTYVSVWLLLPKVCSPITKLPSLAQLRPFYVPAAYRCSGCKHCYITAGAYTRNIDKWLMHKLVWLHETKNHPDKEAILMYKTLHTSSLL